MALAGSWSICATETSRRTSSTGNGWPAAAPMRHLIFGSSIPQLSLRSSTPTAATSGAMYRARRCADRTLAQAVDCAARHAERLSGADCGSRRRAQGGIGPLRRCQRSLNMPISRSASAATASRAGRSGTPEEPCTPGHRYRILKRADQLDSCSRIVLGRLVQSPLTRPVRAHTLVGHGKEVVQRMNDFWTCEVTAS